ncbi:MAG: AmmeMemoRadiSam system protein A [Candidatus Pacebacteria bacterium]|nr:AmmeMemoRadiSam system protein A [Candidatus Paceibacterota bacterium]
MHPLISLAQKAVEKYLNEGKIISPPLELPKEFLEKKAGVFVTIQKDGDLRGCMGTYLPMRSNIALETIRNAVTAATEDYRFSPINKIELPLLNYTVSILSQPEPVKDVSELNPKKYGIIVKSSSMFEKNSASKCGLLLPDLEDVDTIEKQVFIACRKGDIDPGKEKLSIYRFTVEKLS